MFIGSVDSVGWVDREYCECSNEQDINNTPMAMGQGG